LMSRPPGLSSVQDQTASFKLEPWAELFHYPAYRGNKPSHQSDQHKEADTVGGSHVNWPSGFIRTLCKTFHFKPGPLYSPAIPSNQLRNLQTRKSGKLNTTCNRPIWSWNSSSSSMNSCQKEKARIRSPGSLLWMRNSAPSWLNKAAAQSRRFKGSKTGRLMSSNQKPWQPELASQDGQAQSASAAEPQYPGGHQHMFS